MHRAVRSGKLQYLRAVPTSTPRIILPRPSAGAGTIRDGVDNALAVAHPCAAVSRRSTAPAPPRSVPKSGRTRRSACNMSFPASAANCMAENEPVAAPVAHPQVPPSQTRRGTAAADAEYNQGAGVRPGDVGGRWTLDTAGVTASADTAHNGCGPAIRVPRRGPAGSRPALRERARSPPGRVSTPGPPYGADDRRHDAIEPGSPTTACRDGHTVVGMRGGGAGMTCRSGSGRHSCHGPAEEASS